MKTIVKKLMNLVLFSLIHVNVVILVLSINYWVFQISILAIQQQTIIVVTVCTILWILIGCFYERTRILNKKHVILSSIILFALFLAHNIVIYPLYNIIPYIIVVPGRLFRLYGFTGLFYKSILKPDIFEEFGILVYGLYYTLIFVAGVGIRKLYMAKNKVVFSYAQSKPKS